MKTPGEHTAVDTQHGVGVPRRQEVQFADGSAIGLQRVNNPAGPDLFLRRLDAPGTPKHQHVVDLRDLEPALGIDLPIAATRDVPGTVWFSLRGRYRSAAQLLEAAR